MKQALVIARQGTFRDQLRNVLAKLGMKVTFDGATSRVQYMLSQLKPTMLVYDWEMADPSQGARLFQKLNGDSSAVGLIKIIIAPKITPNLSAISIDCGIHRILSPTMTQLSMEPEIEMVNSAQATKSDLQKKVAEMCASSNQYDQSTVDEVVEKAYREHAHDPDIKIEYGNLCLRRDDHRDALKIAKEMIDSRPEDVRAMSLMSRALMRDGRAKEALQVLNYANSLSPENASRLVLMGDANMACEDFSDARECYHQAMQIDPDRRDAKEGQALADISQGDIDQAVDLLKSSLSEEESVAFFNNSGVRAAWKKDPSNAIVFYETALKVVRSDKYKPKIWFNLAMGYLRMNKLDQALYAARRSLNYDRAYEKATVLVKQIESLRRQEGQESSEDISNAS